MTQPGQQLLPGRVGVGDLYQIQVGDGGEQTLEWAVVNADRDEFRVVGAQRGSPFHAPVVRLEIVARQHGHDHGGVPHAPSMKSMKSVPGTKFHACSSVRCPAASSCQAIQVAQRSSAGE